MTSIAGLARCSSGETDAPGWLRIATEKSARASPVYRIHSGRGICRFFISRSEDFIDLGSAGRCIPSVFARDDGGRQNARETEDAENEQQLGSCRRNKPPAEYNPTNDVAPYEQRS